MLNANTQQVLPLGHLVEKNIIQSLKMAGVPLQKSAELDHQHKIDFLITIAGEIVGIQCSLKQDWIKAKVAKICALDRVTRFIYLTFSDTLFRHPEKDSGHKLFQLLTHVIETHSHKALCLCIGLDGWFVKIL